jgi:protoporphyrinogen IX oxidase
MGELTFDPLYVKALHIIFVVTWFAGLFYIVRLFIYHAEARDREEPARTILEEQYKLMEWRLWYIITWPSLILTWVFGLWLVYLYNWWFAPWLWLKLSMVAGLTAYHLYCHRIFQNFQKDRGTWGSMALRIWNEVATLFLFAIVFVVVMKSTIHWLWGMLGLMLLAGTMMLGIRIYRNRRAKR